MNRILKFVSIIITTTLLCQHMAWGEGGSLRPLASAERESLRFQKKEVTSIIEKAKKELVFWQNNAGIRTNYSYSEFVISHFNSLINECEQAVRDDDPLLEYRIAMLREQAMHLGNTREIMGQDFSVDSFIRALKQEAGITDPVDPDHRDAMAAAREIANEHQEDIPGYNPERVWFIPKRCWLRNFFGINRRNYALSIPMSNNEDDNLEHIVVINAETHGYIPILWAIIHESSHFKYISESLFFKIFEEAIVEEKTIELITANEKKRRGWLSHLLPNREINKYAGYSYPKEGNFKRNVCDALGSQFEAAVTACLENRGSGEAKEAPLINLLGPSMWEGISALTEVVTSQEPAGGLPWLMSYENPAYLAYLKVMNHVLVALPREALRGAGLVEQEVERRKRLVEKKLEACTRLIQSFYECKGLVLGCVKINFRDVQFDLSNDTVCRTEALNELIDQILEAKERKDINLEGLELEKRFLHRLIDAAADVTKLPLAAPKLEGTLQARSNTLAELSVLRPRPYVGRTKPTSEVGNGSWYLRPVAAKEQVKRTSFPTPPSKEDLINFYDTLDEETAKERGILVSYASRYPYVLERLVAVIGREDVIRDEQGLDILSIGSGRGEVEEALKDKGWSVTCVDLSEMNAELARKRGIETIVGDAHNLNLNKKFDIVLLSESIGHMRINEIFYVIKRHLKENGSAVITTYQPWEPIGVKPNADFPKTLYIKYPTYHLRKAWEGAGLHPTRFVSIGVGEDSEGCIHSLNVFILGHVLLDAGRAELNSSVLRPVAAGERDLTMMGMKFVFFNQSFDNPHTHKGQIPDAFGCGNFLEAFYLCFIHPYRDKALLRLREFNISNLPKFMRIIHKRMRVPESRFFLSRFKFGNAFCFSHCYLPPSVSLPFRLVHIPCSDYPRDSSKFVLKYDHNISTCVSLPKGIVSIKTPSKYKRIIKAGLFNLFGRYTMPGNMVYISFIPFKRQNFQSGSLIQYKYICIYKRCQEKNET